MKIGLQGSSLGLKFVLLVAVVLLVTMSSSAYYSISLETEKQTEDFKEKAILLAEVVSHVSPEAIYAFDFFTLNENIKEVSLRKDVIYCAIKDDKGQYITSFINKDDEFIKKAIQKSSSEDLAVILPLIDEEEYSLTVKKSILYDGEYLGEVYIGLTRQKIVESYRSAVIRQFLLSAGVILFLSLIIYYIFKQSALNRINELILCSEAVSNGDLNQKITIDNTDELSQLGQSFNQMIRNLKSSIGLKELALNQIKELNVTLENKVQERTEELKSTNDELFSQQEELKKHRDNLQELVKDQMADIIKEKEKVEVVSAAKTEFLANMSHELRTPLHAILSFANFGIKKFDTASKESVKNYFDKIEQSGSRLLELVNDLLDLAKLESGKLVLNIQEYDLLDINKHVNGEFELIYKKKSIAINVECEKDCIFIECDKQKIEQVCRNLMSNAVKFTAENSQIDIVITEEKNSVKFSVTDQGIGIPKPELDDVFDKFVQSSKTKNGSGGTGLGLAISKQIIEHHGGVITAENTEKGARFWFSLPKTQNQLQDKG